LGVVLLALGALVIIAGIVAALALFVFNNKPADIEVRAPQTPAASESSGTASPTTGVGTKVTAVGNDQVFTFRDVFEPLLKPVNQTTTNTNTTTNTSTTTTTPVDSSDYSADTLYLIDIITEGGVQKAVMVWDKEEMKLAEGQSIVGTPWKVLDIRESSVIMLYGDQQVTLTVGQGISK
jgi:hypothetical protein